MATIFVAYGEDGREDVLAFAAERARASGDDLFVYHYQETADEAAETVRSEVEAVLDEVAPDVAAEVVVEEGRGRSDETNVSSQKKLVDAIRERDPEWSYVVMGNVEHGAVESFVLPSLTEAVLDLRDVPVLLVPV
ncbi:universal stress protein [Halosimplex marinum]|uniref:universal stress protein n=1 Tax=Halosimplex marinum TaxID=3396620 RepID=UPI003F561B0E